LGELVSKQMISIEEALTRSVYPDQLRKKFEALKVEYRPPAASRR